MQSFFIAYPFEPGTMGSSIEAAAGYFRARQGVRQVTTWREMQVAGSFVASAVREQIDDADCLVADVSTTNFNVTYEIGYAIGRGKPVLLIRNPAIKGAVSLTELGIFDSIGYQEYQNSEELITSLKLAGSIDPLTPSANSLNKSAPAYILEAKYKTEAITRIIARVKKARLFYRSFDPQENPRLSAFEAVDQVYQSYGVLVHLLSDHMEDALIHNLRAAFLAGLTDGMDKVLTILQSGNDPVPLDYRDFVKSFLHPESIDDIVTDFATRVTEAIQREAPSRIHEPETLLERLSIGATSAENEIRSLGSYYLETDAFFRARRGEVRMVVGRKGSGKSALFFQLRDSVRRSRKNLVLDLKPEGYKLLKFKEEVLSLLSTGTLEHTVTAYWEYLLLLELCTKALAEDRTLHLRDHRIYDPYRRLADLFSQDELISEGDFSERMTILLGRIQADYNAKFAPSRRSLSEAQVTELLYRHNVPALRSAVIEYLGHKDEVWILFDNLDKGWPTHGLKHEDLLIIRCLLDAARNLERQADRSDIDFHSVVFLRNDVYELLVEETPDRGKEARVLVDWTDPDLLRELLRRRLVANDLDQSTSFDDIWSTIAAPFIEGEESSQYLIDRSLMRPRSLLNLLNHCRSHAVNLRHARVSEEDFKKGLKAYSTDLVSEISLEIRDVFPEGEDVLYGFLDSPATISAQQLHNALALSDLSEDRFEEVTRLLLWFGVLGVIRGQNDVSYIHTVNYDMHLLRSIARRQSVQGLAYYINPAFWAALDIRR